MKRYLIGLVIFLVLFFIATGRYESAINEHKSMTKRIENRVVSGRIETQRARESFTKEIAKVRNHSKVESKKMFDSIYIPDTASTDVVVKANQIVEANINIVRLDSANVMLSLSRNENLMLDSIVKINKIELRKERKSNTLLNGLLIVAVAAVGLGLILK